MVSEDARASEGGGSQRRTESIRGGGLEERRVAAWIGRSIVIRGDLVSSEDLTIAGQVDGDVAARDHVLVVAPEATIRGDVMARSVIIHGEVTGSVNAREKVEVGETGSVDGDIDAPRMTVAEGAVLHGRVKVARAS